MQKRIGGIVMKRKLLSVLLALLMVLSAIPLTAVAADGLVLTALDGTGDKDTKEGYAKLFDGNTSTKWCLQSFDTKNGAFVVFKASESVRVLGYTLTTGNDNASHTGRNPKSWVLYGCNDYSESGKSGGTWKAIHTVTNDTVLKDENKIAFDFSCDSTASYEYFKLEIKSTAGSVLMQLSELSLKIAKGGESVNAEDVYSVIYIDNTCEHEWRTNGVTGDATCISQSYKEVVCEKCGATGRVSTGTAKLGHTHTGAGTQCTRCGRKNLVNIADRLWISSEKPLKEEEDYVLFDATKIRIEVSGKIEVSNIDADASVKTKIEGTEDTELVLFGLNSNSPGSRISLNAAKNNKITLKEGSRNILVCSNVAGDAALSFGLSPVDVGTIEFGSLVISGAGELFCAGGTSRSSDDGGAAIGADCGRSTANITVTGGCKVTALGGGGAAGIGGGGAPSRGDEAFCRNIVIDNATVVAKGAHVVGPIDGGAGIGAGTNGSADGITIKNSTVVAIGAADSAGIGGGKGDGKSVSDIYIEGSTVYAEGGYGGAGIGAGRWKTDVSDITIKDSTVTAVGGDNGTGIGGGLLNGGENTTSTVNNIVIMNSTITATGNGKGAGIGAVTPDSGNTANVSGVTITDSIVTATSTGSGAGIGGGSAVNCSGIKIKNSTATVKSNSLPAICTGGAKSDVVIQEGSVKLISGKSFNIGSLDSAITPKNQNGDELVFFELANPKGRNVVINAVFWNPLNHTALDPEDTTLYAFIPKSTTDVHFSDDAGYKLHMHYIEEENLFVSEPWEAGWDANNLYHWHNCTYKASLGCTVTTEKVSHTYDSDGVCLVCGYGKRYDIVFSAIDFSSGKYTEYSTKTLDNLSAVILNGVKAPASNYTSLRIFDGWVVDWESYVPVNSETKLGDVAVYGTSSGSSGERSLKITAVYSEPLLKITSTEKLVEGTDFIYDENGITILTDKPVTVSNSYEYVVSNDTITVGDGVSANITLENVNIDVSDEDDAAAFKIETGSKGNVTVTLSGENTLKSGKNCAGLQKSGTNGTLSINGSGKLTAEGGSGGAGIGGGYNANGVNITAEGGAITATGGQGGAGIGGGCLGSGKNITIKGFTGSVTSNDSIPTVTVTATGGENSAGIGGGFAEGIAVIKGLATIKSTGETIETEPVITANSEQSIGIGGYDYDTLLPVGNTKIEAGTISASTVPGTATVTGGSVKADVENPVDEDGNKLYKMVIPNTSMGTVLIDGKEYKPSTHMASGDDDTNLYVYLTGEPHTISVNGSVIKYDFKDGKWNRVTDLKITSAEGLFEGTDYTYSDGILTILSEKPVVISMRDGVLITSDIIKVADGVSADITLNGVNIDSSGTGSIAEGEPAFEIAAGSTGSVTLTLKEGTVNTLKGGRYCAGLQKNGENGTLTIKGKGTLNATGGFGGAGIGASLDKASGIIIEDGIINAKGNFGAGIGGGYESLDGKKLYGDGENITISGGTVTAEGGTYSAGIGGGAMYGGARNITITGGFVTAIAGEGSSAIGNANKSGDRNTADVQNIRITGGTVVAKVTGTEGTAIGGTKTSGKVDNIVISGGTVTAEGGYVGIGTTLDESALGKIEISGGSVKATFSYKNYGVAIGKFNTPVVPANENGESVYLLIIENKNGEKVYIDGKEYTPKNHAATGEGNTDLYVYLTGEKHTVKVGSESATYHFDTATKEFVKKECYDNTNDHRCDLCGEIISDHKDADLNTKCDICGIDFILYGDVNGDGEVTPSDVVLLRRYFANYDSETGKSAISVAPGGDVNGDGELTPSDVVLLRRYFANYNSDTGTSTVVIGK